MKIALVGLGAIGQEVLKCLGASGAQVEILGALVAHPARSRGCRAFSTVDELLAARLTPLPASKSFGSFALRTRSAETPSRAFCDPAML